MMLKMMIICASLLLIKINTTLAFEIPECRTAQEILCEKLRTADGFTSLPPMNHLPSDCEHGWSYPNGTFIKDSTGGMTPKNLTLSICEDVEWRIDCHTKPVFNCTIKFAAMGSNFTAMEPQTNEDGQEDEKLSVLKNVFIGIGIAIVVGVGLLIIIWKCYPGSTGQNGCRQNGVV